MPAEKRREQELVGPHEHQEDAGSEGGRGHETRPPETCGLPCLFASDSWARLRTSWATLAHSSRASASERSGPPARTTTTRSTPAGSKFGQWRKHSRQMRL